MRTLWSSTGDRWYRVRLYTVGPRGGRTQVAFISTRANSKGDAIRTAERDYAARLAADVEVE